MKGQWKLFVDGDPFLKTDSFADILILASVLKDEFDCAGEFNKKICVIWVSNYEPS